MNTSPVPDTIRLTMAQAVVKYLQAQYSERDGKSRRLDPGDVRHLRPRQRLRHGAGARGMRPASCPITSPATSNRWFIPPSVSPRPTCGWRRWPARASIGPGSTNMITGAAAATINRLPVLLFPSDYYATRHQGPVLAAARASDLGGRERQRLLPAGQPLFRSHHAAPSSS